MFNIPGAGLRVGFLRVSFFLLLSCLFLARSPLVAQEINSSIVTYDQAYFSQYNPLTLRDMIQQVPGGAGMLKQLADDDGNRGFGSSGPQILLNGKRISGKNNDMESRLNRTLAAQVIRIELIRGNAEGLDIKSDGILYNVILREGQDEATNFFNLRADYIKGKTVRPRLLLSRNGSWKGLEYNLTYLRNIWLRREKFDEDHFSPDYSFISFNSELQDRLFRNHEFSGNIKYNFANGDSLRLNGLYETGDFGGNNIEKIYFPEGNQLGLDRTVARIFHEDKFEWEFGGDYETQTALGNLKILFVLNRDVDNGINRREDSKNGSTVQKYKDFIHEDTQEKILRTTLNRDLSTRHSLETGAELALNSLNKATVFSNVIAQNPDSRVKETRVEIFFTHSYKISDSLSLQSTLNSEYSKIGQVGSNIDQSRDFYFIKPRVELRYDINAQDQLRLLVDRAVSQLDFHDFVARFNADINAVTAGNPQLVPERTWQSSLSYEKRFADDKGSAEVTLFYDHTSDHIDVVEVSPGRTGTGNIGNAVRYGVEVKNNMRLNFIGLDDAILSLTGRWQETEVTDPFTGKKRQIRWKSNTSYSISYRHNVARWNIVYGIDLTEHGANSRSSLTVVDTNRSGTGVIGSAYVEYTLANNLKLSIKGLSLFNDPRSKSRHFFVDDIRLGITDHFEEQRRYVSRKILFTIEGGF